MEDQGRYARAKLITTPRLRLRRWEPSDLASFAEICADEEVMEFFPAPISRQQSDDFIARVDRHFDEHGYGFWAAECLEGPRLMGFVGLAQVAFAADFVPAVEIGWRLAASDWAGSSRRTEAV
ncbi:MAG: GNAT family N-acetyltransferase [Myxococcota bacterium]|nr:GNAT family N-acetyltransferase [Myxococcota bacterium]